MKNMQKFYPKIELNKITDIDEEILKNNNIKAVFLDIDNTIIDVDHKIIDGLEDWVKLLKQNNIKLCIVSNTSHKEKAEKLSNLLEIPYINFSTKPFKRGFKKAKDLLDIKDNTTVAVVGDQVLTDVLGANRMNMISILVKPLNEKDILVTKFNRLIEKKILNKYHKSKEKGK